MCFEVIEKDILVVTFTKEIEANRAKNGEKRFMHLTTMTWDKGFVVVIVCCKGATFFLFKAPPNVP